MKKILFILIITLTLVGCHTINNVPMEHKIQYTYKDSLIERVDTNYILIEKTLYRDYVNISDTLHLTSKYGYATAFIDTLNHILKGEITTTQQKIPYYTLNKEHIVYKDSIEFVEKPIEVITYKTKHPKYEIYLWLYVILTLGLFGIIYKKAHL